jgi:hypothetical protein
MLNLAGKIPIYQTMIVSIWLQRRIIKNKDDVKTGPFGSSLKKEIFVPSGYKVYGQENVIPDDFTIGICFRFKWRPYLVTL